MGAPAADRKVAVRVAVAMRAADARMTGMDVHRRARAARAVMPPAVLVVGSAVARARRAEVTEVATAAVSADPQRVVDPALEARVRAAVRVKAVSANVAKAASVSAAKPLFDARWAACTTNARTAAAATRRRAVRSGKTGTPGKIVATRAAAAVMGIVVPIEVVIAAVIAEARVAATAAASAAMIGALTEVDSVAVPVVMTAVALAATEAVSAAVNAAETEAAMV